jgi:hypothetical protein
VNRSVALSAVVAALVFGSLVAGVTPVSGQSGGGAADDLGLEELRPGGDHPANAPPSVRAGGTYSEYAVKHLPTGLLVRESPDSASWRYLRQGTTVDRDKLQVWSKRGYGEPEKEVVIRVAYWQRGTRTITAEDGSERQVPVAENVTTHSTSATLGGGYDFVTVNLRPHFDQPRKAVMCVQEPGEPSCLANPREGVRWRFSHHTSETSKVAPVSSLGGQLAWGYGWLVLPFFLASVVTLYGGRAAVRQAKAPPNISPVWYIVGVVILALVLIGAWDFVAETLATAPWVLSAGAGVILGVIAVEWFSSETYGALFLRLSLTDGAPDPPGDAPGEGAVADGGEQPPADKANAPGVLAADAIPVPFARGEDGARTAVRDGLRRWWARARGARADFDPDGNMRTRVEVDQGPYEELFFLHPEDDEALSYEPERHELKLPELIEHEEIGLEDGETETRRNLNVAPWILGLGWLGATWFGGQLLVGSSTLGVLLGAGALVAFKIARPVSGHLKANLAPLHYHRAVGTMLQHAEGVSEAKAWDTLFRELSEEKAENKADKSDLADEASSSQLDQLFDRYTGRSDGAGGGPVGRRDEEPDTEAPADD